MKIFPSLGHRVLGFIIISSLLSFPPFFAQGQTVPVRDPQAVTLIHNAIAATGGAIPADSVANGKIVITEGSRIENGTIRILTRGPDQSAEHIQLSSENRSIIYSRGQANEVARGATKWVPLELAATSHCPDYPLLLLAAALANPDMAFQYVGAESIDGLAVHHVRIWNTYGSNEKMRTHLSEFTRKDLWFDAVTGLPRKLVYERREGHGAAVAIRMEILYSDWRTISGTQYPYKIDKLWNGVPWTTITIQNVAFQAGLSDNDFPVKLQSEVK